MNKMTMMSESSGSGRRKAFPAGNPGLLVASLLLVTTSLGCNFAPKYHTPTVQTPTAYKELTPETLKDTDGWKMAQPKDDAIRGKWWEMFNDPQLNTFEEQVSISNQNIAAAAASYLVARALVREARAQYFPTATANPAITNSRQPKSGTQFTASPGKSITNYDLPFDATWQPDLWGRVRNTVRSNTYAAQASAADLANVQLTVHAEVAADYFQLRTQDALKQLLDSTVVAFEESLKLTQALYETGIDSDEAVAQAETQLHAAQTQDTGVGVARAQLEHAIAMLVGQPASSFSIPVEPLNATPPAIPFGVPSQLLERRPDIAASERLVAQANAQIGIAKAAFFPTVTLNAAAGFTSTAIGNWFTWPSRFWSVGPTAAQSLFDAGLRRATVQQFQATYLQDVANYRQTVLTAFQQIEDNLSSLRILSQEIQQQDTAVKSAERNLALATDRYKLGIDPYLNVITAQTTLLSNQQTAVNLRLQQMTASVQLIEALGGGWDSSQVPSPTELAKAPQNPKAGP